VAGFLDVEAPEDAGDGDKEGLFGDLLTRTDSATPSERRVALSIGIREIFRQIPVGIERMWVRIIFGIMVNLQSTLSGDRWGDTAQRFPKMVDPLGMKYPL